MAELPESVIAERAEYRLNQLVDLLKGMMLAYRLLLIWSVLLLLQVIDLNWFTMLVALCLLVLCVGFELYRAILVGLYIWRK